MAEAELAEAQVLEAACAEAGGGEARSPAPPATSFREAFTALGTDQGDSDA